MFVWRTSSDGGKAELKNRPELGDVLKSVVLAKPSAYDGVNDLNEVKDTVLLSTSDNRVLLFSERTGAQTTQVFGYVVGVDRQMLT